MYAVITTGGKQYRVAQGQRLRVEKIESAIGETIELGGIQMLATDDGVVMGVENLGSAKVLADIVEHGRKKKIRVFKYKRRKQYHRTRGHRQSYTDIRIREITA